MSRRLIYLTRAKRDLVEILTHVSRQTGNPSTARAFVDALRAQCTRLSRLPGRLGRQRPELGEDIRSFPIRDYVIFFRYLPDGVAIIAVLSRYRDIDRVG